LPRRSSKTLPHAFTSLHTMFALTLKRAETPPEAADSMEWLERPGLKRTGSLQPRLQHTVGPAPADTLSPTLCQCQHSTILTAISPGENVCPVRLALCLFVVFRSPNHVPDKPVTDSAAKQVTFMFLILKPPLVTSTGICHMAAITVTACRHSVTMAYSGGNFKGQAC